MRRLFSVFVISALLVLPSVAFGQASGTTGEIRGTVYDEQGAVVAGAKVTVTNSETGISTPGMA